MSLQNSEMKEISVEDLQWVSSGFSVKYKGKYCWLRFFAIDGYHVKTVDGFDFIPNDQKVFVGEVSYQKDVIQTIKEFLDVDIKKVEKRLEYDSLEAQKSGEKQHLYIVVTTSEDVEIYIKPDPRPWDNSEYVIEL